MQHPGNQVALRCVVFAKITAGIGSSGIEVAKDHCGQPVSSGAIPDQHLHHPLATTVGIDGLLGAILADGHLLRVAIDGAGGGKHQGQRRPVAALPFLNQGLQQNHGVPQVVAVIGNRIRNGLPHSGVGGKVEHRFNVLPGQDGLQLLTVPQLGHHQWGLQHPLNQITMTMNQVVQHDGVMASVLKSSNGVGANVAATTGHQNAHLCRDNMIHPNPGAECGRTPA